MDRQFLLTGAVLLAAFVTGILFSSVAIFQDTAGVCGSREINESYDYRHFERLADYDANYSLQGNERPGLPAFTVDRNRLGLREEDISLENTVNITRILVLGDSYTFGSGINRSDRYTDILERLLNNASRTSVEVINAGIPGGGMKDYYFALKRQGLRYNPDIVIVSFSQQDAHSKKMNQRWLEIATRRINHTDISKDNITQIRREMKRCCARDFYNGLTWRNSPIKVYGNKIISLSQQHNITPVFFRLGSLMQYMERPQQFNKKNRYRQWSRRCGFRYVEAPWFRTYATFEPPYTEQRYLYPDGHINPRTNRLIAVGLHRFLTNHTLLPGR